VARRNTAAIPLEQHRGQQKQPEKEVEPEIADAHYEQTATDGGDEGRSYDVAKYFAIVPAMFAGTLPWLKAIDVMHLHSPTSAILSAVIFNALIIPLLIPIALKGVQYRPLGADALLRRNLLIWGLGGVIVPFIGIKVIDMVMVALRLVA
jgi:hypothetical protein